jgi:folate-binding protein YgfZ
MSNSPLPQSDYRAAFHGTAVRPASDRHFLKVTGRAPGEMLNGLLSNSPPPPLEPVEGKVGYGSGIPDTNPGKVGGSAVYSTLLNAKGRMITDLRISSDSSGGFLLEIPSAGFEGAVAHFSKFLPPRLAGLEDRSPFMAALTLLGPEVPGLLASALSSYGLAVSGEEVLAIGEEDVLVLFGRNGETFRIMGRGDALVPGWDLILPERLSEAVQSALEGTGATPLSEATLDILRIEKGRPLFGRDMDENTIPVEAGIQARAIDNQKGCYTGQEVIIRIRDRGHVNKELRGLLLGGAPVATFRQELFHPDRENSVGWVTSSAASPHFGQTVALGYLQRAVKPGDTVRLGDAAGPEARVVALSDQGWVLD